MADPTWRNVYDRVEEKLTKLSRWDGTPMLIGTREQLQSLVRAIVLDAAAVCDELGEGLASGSPDAMSAANICAVRIVQRLLCLEGEIACIPCHGRGCTQCSGQGVVRPKRVTP